MERVVLCVFSLFHEMFAYGAGSVMCFSLFQEMFAYGAGSVLCSIFSGYIPAASVARSAIQDGAGGKTQVHVFSVQCSRVQCSVFTCSRVQCSVFFIRKWCLHFGGEGYTSNKAICFGSILTKALFSTRRYPLIKMC